jgi:hypothetical protein
MPGIVRSLNRPSHMQKSLRHSIFCGLIAVATLVAAAPASQASFDSGLYKSVLKTIYNKSSEGDGGDIFTIIRRALRENPDQGEDLVKKLIATLEDNIDKLDDGISTDDLKQINKRLKKYLKQHQVVQVSHGNITRSESTVN